jgi:hypothetical protein
MFEAIQTYFYDYVVAAYEDYARHRDDNTSGRHRHLSTALHACAALFHFREHLPDPHTMTWRQVVALCPDYRLIAAVTNASKHSELTRNDPMGRPPIDDVEQLEELTIVTRFRDEQGEYADAQSRIFANCTDGVSRNLDEAITNVLNFWGIQLSCWGMANFRTVPVPRFPGTYFVPRDKARNLDFEVLAPLGLRHSIQLLRFDPVQGTAVPIDLTGSDIEFKLYRPAFTLDITFPAPDGGHPIKCSLALTDEESQAFAALNNDEERDVFMRRLAASRQEELQRQVSAALTARPPATL